jgi:hypothetical protein
MLSTINTGRFAFFFSSFIPIGSSSAATVESAGSGASAAPPLAGAVVPGFCLKRR